jgi:transcriptional regulator GlxA family with amidase domain
MLEDPLNRLAQQSRRRRPLNVAVVVANGATMIDFAGPWQVLSDSRIDGRRHFRLYTVSPSLNPVSLSEGLQVVPQFTLKGSPKPDIVLVGALGRSSSQEIVEWIRDAHRRGTLIISVCTGAFQLAAAGVLDGRPATTHHDFVDRLRELYPAVQVKTGLRFVRSSPNVYTAGGLTSGIDLAYHVVSKILGYRAARNVAKYEEYQGPGWRHQGSFAKLGGRFDDELA